MSRLLGASMFLVLLLLSGAATAAVVPLALDNNGVVITGDDQIVDVDFASNGSGGWLVSVGNGLNFEEFFANFSQPVGAGDIDIVTAGWSRVIIFSLLAFALILNSASPDPESWFSERLFGLVDILNRINLVWFADAVSGAAGLVGSSLFALLTQTAAIMFCTARSLTSGPISVPSLSGSPIGTCL